MAPLACSSSFAGELCKLFFEVKLLAYRGRFSQQNCFSRRTTIQSWPCQERNESVRGRNRIGKYYGAAHFGPPFWDLPQDCKSENRSGHLKTLTSYHLIQVIYWYMHIISLVISRLAWPGRLSAEFFALIVICISRFALQGVHHIPSSSYSQPRP